MRDARKQFRSWLLGKKRRGGTLAAALLFVGAMVAAPLGVLAAGGQEGNIRDEVKIAVLSDMHYYPVNFVSDCADYTTYVGGDPKMLEESGSIADTALEMVRNRVMVTPPRPNYTWLYIDEVQSLFAHPTVVEYFARLWREGRKFGLICTGISQNTSHMLANAEARDMVLNSEFFLLHKQSTADLDAWAEMLQLSATERGYIGDAVKPGEGLLISAGIRVPITDDFPKGSLYDLWNTKPAEVAEREMRRAAREAEE